MPWLSENERNRARGVLMVDWTKQNIATTFGCSVSTVTRLEQRVHQTGSVKDFPRPGQPCPLPRPPLNVRTGRWGWIIYGTGFWRKRKRQDRRTSRWIHTCMGRNYTTQQDASCCFQPQRERQFVCEWSVGTYCGSFHARQFPQRKRYSATGWCQATYSYGHTTVYCR